MRAPQPSDHLARLEDTARLAPAAILGREHMPQMLAAAKRRRAVLGPEAEHGLAPLRVDTEHGCRSPVGTNDEIADAKGADRLEAVWRQDASVDRLGAPTH